MRVKNKIMIYEIKFEAKHFTEFDFNNTWIIAQDMEHIDHLHKKTNELIKLNEINFNKDLQINKLYNYINYTAIRKIFYFFKIKINGYRKIIHDYEILQTEKFLFFEINLISKYSFDDESKKTCIHDIFCIKIPIFFYPFKKILELAVRKHIKSQFLEDEFYRKRLKELNDRGIKKKYIFLTKLNG